MMMLRQPIRRDDPTVYIILDRDDAPVGRIVSSYDHYEYEDENRNIRRGCLHNASIDMHVPGYAPIKDSCNSWTSYKEPDMGALWCILAHHFDAIVEMIGYEDADIDLPDYEDFDRDWQELFTDGGFSIVKAV